MLYKFRLLLVAAACIGLSFPVKTYAEQTISCPAGQYDMLDWLTLDSDLRDSNFLAGADLPQYTAVWANDPSPKYFWLKGSSGHPWDINLFDNSYIYRWKTEGDNAWNDPTSFKKAYTNTNKPFIARCANAGSPGWRQAIPPTGTPFNTQYGVYQSCQLVEVRNLNWVVNELWGPYSENFGGNIPNPITTLVVSYRHGCTKNQDGSYSCKEKEAYHLAQRYGLVQWQHFSSNNTCDIHGNCTWTNDNTSTHSTLSPGSAVPDTPCS
jgi:hypothetical protein